MGGVNHIRNQQGSSANISIAMSLSSGLNSLGGGGAQAFAGPNGAFAQAGNAVAQAGQFGGLQPFGGGGCGCHGGPNLANSFGPQNPYQAGFQQGAKMAKLQRLQRRLAREMAQLQGGGVPGLGFGGPGALGLGGSGFGVPGLGQRFV
jgi:hypothetical protein